MSVRFSVAANRLNLATAPPDPSAGFTVTAWVYLSVDRDDFSTICRLHANSGASTTATMGTHGSGTTMGYITGGGQLVSGHALTVGLWSRVAIACTGTAGKIYAAAETGDTNVVSGTVGGAASPTALTVGGRSTGDAGEWFNGRVAQMRVWDVELSQAQIEAEWASTTAVRAAWGWWPLSSHLDLTDHSGNGRHLSAGTVEATTEADPPIEDDEEEEPEPEPTPAVATGWWTLQTITDNARQWRQEEASRAPTTCPNDGMALQTGPDGSLFCPFDGWKPQ